MLVRCLAVLLLVAFAAAELEAASESRMVATTTTARPALFVDRRALADATTTTTSKHVRVTDIADTLARLAHVPAVSHGDNDNNDNNDNNTDNSNDSATTTLLLVVDGVSGDELSAALPTLAGHSRRVDVDRASLDDTDNSLALLTSMMTGATCAVHGIDDSVLERGAMVHAYTARASRRRASFADVLAQRFPARAVTLAASANAQMAAALGVHRRLLAAHGAWPSQVWYTHGSHVVHYPEHTRHSSTDVARLADVERRDDAPLPFDANSAATRFVREHAMLNRALDSFAHAPRDADASHLLALGVSTLRGVRAEYGDQSTQYASALAATASLYERLRAFATAAAATASHARTHVHALALAALDGEKTDPNTMLYRAAGASHLVKRSFMRDAEVGEFDEDDEYDEDDDDDDTANGSRTYTGEQVGEFHMCLWTTVLLVLVMLGIWSCICTIDTSNEPMLQCVAK